MKNSRQYKGFTLIEFLFVAFTLALFLTALFNITTGGLRAYQRGVVQTELKHELRNIVDRVTTDIRQLNLEAGTNPDRYYTTGSTEPTESFMFYRYTYVADNTLPQGNTQVVYRVNAGSPLSLGGVNYSVSDFVRTENAGGTVTNQTLSSHCVEMDDSTGKYISKTHFCWDHDPYPSGTANIDTVRFHIKLLRTHSGSVEPETIENIVRISLRSTRGLITNSAYYPPASADAPYANIQRFGSPTSLIRP